MKNEDLKKRIDKILNNMPYKYYAPHPTECIDYAFKQERNYVFNCSDFEKDFSNEAVNRRFLNNIRKCKKRRGY